MSTLKLSDFGIVLSDYHQGEHRTTCPKCSTFRSKKGDKCLSVKIDGDHAVWLCHHCDWRGTTSTKECEPYIPPRKVEPAVSPKVLDFFYQRGISTNTLEKYNISESGGSIYYPYIWEGNVSGYKVRSVGKSFKQEGKCDVFFGCQHLTSSRVVIVEGEMDVLALAEIGVQAISVPNGAPMQVSKDDPDPEKDNKYKYIWNCLQILNDKEILIGTDMDTPGNALAEELARRLGKERCKRVAWPLKDANEVLIKLGPSAIETAIETAEEFPVTGLYSVSRYMDSVYLLYEGGRARGMPTGWPQLNGLLTIPDGQLIVITGIPGHGKSEWIDALTVNLAENEGWRFAMCSFENPPEDHIVKLAEKRNRLPFWAWEGVRMSEGELTRALGWVDAHYWFIQADEETPTIDWILDKAKIGVVRHGINGLVIDPYNELEHKRPAGMSETEYISLMLGKVKRFCQNHRVTAFFVAHPFKLHNTEDGQEPIPTLYTISGSAHWNNKADIGVAIYRIADSKTVEIHIQKVRFKWAGQRGKAVLEYDIATGRYE